MKGSAWGAPTTPEEAFARAGGRRRFNAWRKDMAVIRRAEVARLLATHGRVPGIQTLIARQLGVSEATISRDVAAIFEAAPPCSTCGAPKPTLE